MKLIFDCLAIAAFFITYKIYNMYVAIAVAMGFYTLQIFFIIFIKKQIDKIQIISWLLVISLGSASFIFNDPMFFKWKPSAIYLLFSLIFFCTLYWGKKTAIEHLLASQVKLPKLSWRKLNLAWALFFSVMSVANLYVAYNFSTDTWVNFKLFGTMLLTLIFVIIQAIYISKFQNYEKS